MSKEIADDIASDIASIAKIDAVKHILEVVCRTTGLGFSAVARVTESRWVACAVRDEIEFGLEPGGELQVQTTICNEIRQSGQLVAIDHVAEDMAFHNHPTPRLYGFQSYISVPIYLPDGRFFGTLCAIDSKPARLQTPEIIGMFKLFADLIGYHLDSQERVAASEAALLSEREAAQLREQFIAVLGHDLRNPLAAIDAGVDLLRTLPRGADTAFVLDLIKRSTGRMTELISNVLDFARGRLGGGLTLSRTADANLETALSQVVSELQSTALERSIECELAINRTVYCDSARIAQMLSNLLANALKHGDPSSPVWVKADTFQMSFELSVTNLGSTIEPRIMEQLFEPFSRGSALPGQEGLGLGLYIATEIARAHEGTLEVTSSDGKTCFTFKMPVSEE
jgi:signal transduction histidine kinase